MPAAKLNLTIEQGTTFEKSLIWRDKNKRPVPLTGYTARMQIRPSVSSSEVILELSTANGRIILGAGGSIKFVLTPELTSALKAGVYDLELTDSLGRVTRLIEGKVTVSPEVTR
jgi:hypothetical protein